MEKIAWQLITTLAPNAGSNNAELTRIAGREYVLSSLKPHVVPATTVVTTVKASGMAKVGFKFYTASPRRLEDTKKSLQ